MTSSERFARDQQVAGPLTLCSEMAHDRARMVLTGSDAAFMDAVVWLSAHLTAMDRVIYPVMAKLLSGQQTELQRLHASTRRMQAGLRALEQRCAGDGMMAARSLGTLRDRMLVLIDENAALEHALLARLAGVVDDEAAESLVARYEHAVRHGPTRPHPHAPRRGRLGRLAYVVDAMRDHALDVMDSRRVPLPKDAVTRRRLGRWGYYALGVGDPKDWPPQAGPSHPVDEPPGHDEPPGRTDDPAGR
jgi:hypothetical protein